MNPMTNMKNVLKLSENDLKGNNKTSWHDMYKDSAWIFVGGFPYDLTEGDIVCVFSQYGEIVNINLIRDKVTGKQKGFCFICYEDQRSTILAVDNLNGIKILGRTIRVDHVSEYKVPKINDKVDEITKNLYFEGCAPKPQIPIDEIKKEININSVEKELNSNGDIKLPLRLPVDRIKKENEIKQESNKMKKIKKEEKEKKSIKEDKFKKKHSESASSSSTSSFTESDNDNVSNDGNRSDSSDFSRSSKNSICKNNGESYKKQKGRSRSKSISKNMSRNGKRESRSRSRDHIRKN